MARRHADPNAYEEERWTLKRDSKLFQGWKEKLVYSFTNRGVFSKLTLYNTEGKEIRYAWANAHITAEALEKRGFTVTKRRKPKRLSIK